MSNISEGVAYALPCDMVEPSGASPTDIALPPIGSFGLDEQGAFADGVQSRTSQEGSEPAAGASSSAETLSLPSAEKQTNPFYDRDGRDLLNPYIDHAVLSHDHSSYAVQDQLDDSQLVTAKLEPADQVIKAFPTDDDNEIPFVQGQLDPALTRPQDMAGPTYLEQCNSSSQDLCEIYYIPNDPGHGYEMGQHAYNLPPLMPDHNSAYSNNPNGSRPGLPDHHEKSLNNYTSLFYPRPNYDRFAAPKTHDQPLTFMEPDAPDFVPKMSEILNADHNETDTDTLFASMDEASQFEPAEDIVQDETVPHTQQQQRAVVKALFNAVKSTENAEDNPGMIKPFAEGKYSDRRIEILCWNIMHTCAVRHTRGPLLMPFELKRKQTAQINTYAERMSKIIECLMTQKTICKHLLDPYYLFQFIDDPVASQKRVVANKNLNKRKGHIMNAGKKIFGKSSSASSPQTKLDDSFVSEASTHGMTPSSNLDDPDRTITPDGSFMENMGLGNPTSSTTSSPSAGRVSLNIGVTARPTAHHMPHDLAQPMSSQHSSPSPAPKGTHMDHIRRFHTRRTSGSIPYSRGEGPHTPSHSRDASFDNAGANSFAFGGVRYSFMPEDPHPAQPRSEPGSTSSNGHKRSLSQVDDVEDSSSPEKKQR